jgi:hypothetical protein
MAEEQKQNSPWLKFHTGLAFGVVLGGSLTLAFAPALPVAVGVIATTTIIWGAIGYLAEEYQKNNLENGSNISSPSPSRRFSEEAEEDFATPPTSHKSVLETGLRLSSQRDKGKILQEPPRIRGRALFLPPSPNSPNDSVNVRKLIPYANPTTLESIIFDREESFPGSPQSTPQASPSMTRKRRSASPSPSETKSRSPIYVSTAPSNSTITADIVLFSPNPLATNPTRPRYYIDTPRIAKVSQVRIEAINAIDRKNEGKEEDPLTIEMRSAGEEGIPSLVRRGWQKMAASTVNQL